MKITVQPETPEEEAWVRDRAAMRPSSSFDAGGITEACKEWVEENPRRPLPGSVLRYNENGNLRYVSSSGSLLGLGGERKRLRDVWRIGTGTDEYTIVYDHKEK